jgi:hypothetical protein
VKRPWKPHYPKNTGPLPERWISERGQARDILAAWEYNKDKAMVERMLVASEKIYGQGSAERIRQHMKDIYRERNAHD